MMTKGLQVAQDISGQWAMEGFQGVPVHTMTDKEPVFDWLEALGLPKDRAKLEAMAHTDNLSQRHIRFILADESVTKLEGSPRFQPRQWIYTPGGYDLTLSHLGLVVGFLDDILPAQSGELPDGATEGLALIAEATLHESPLAEAAWRGIQRGIFGHACATIQHLKVPLTTGEVVDRAKLLEVALVDRPACLNARIIKIWEDV